MTHDRWPVRALVVDALAAEALGRHEEALEVLGTAAATAAVERVREPFLVSGRQVRPLLRELVDRGSPHEAEVLRALQGTASHEQVAARLFISLNTLRTHEKHVYRKLGTASRAEAVARGRALGIL